MKSNSEVVQQCYAEFAKGNAQGVLDLLHDDIVWIDPGYPEIPYAGKRVGKSDVLNFFVEMGSTVEFTRFEPQHFYNDGTAVIVKGYFAGKGRASGKIFESEWVMIWEVEDGKVHHYQAFVDTYIVAAGLR